MKLTKARVRRAAFGIGIVLAINALVLGLQLLPTAPFLPTLQTTADDQLMQYGADTLSRGTVVIAAVDDFTLKAYGARTHLELDRRHYADMIRRLKDAGARVVAFDMAFQDPSPSDGVLAQAIDYAMNPKDGSAPMLVILGVSSDDPSTRVPSKGLEYPSFNALPPGIAQAKPIPAAINVDTDGVTVRNLALVHSSGQQQYVALPLVAASAFAASIPGFKADFELLDQPFQLHFGPYFIPTDQFFRMPIYYFSKPQGYAGTAYSVAKIAEGQVAPDALRNRLVLVGPYEATGLADDYPVPTSLNSKMDSVEIWANATQSLIEGKFITPESLPSTLAFMLGLSLVAAIVFLRWGALGWVVTLILGLAYNAYRLVSTANSFRAPSLIGHQLTIELPNFAYVDATLILASAALFTYLFIDEQRRRSAVYSTFGRYVTPAVAQELSSRQASGDLNLGGTRRTATVIFGNLYLPHVHAEDMLTLLNRYFEGIVRIVNLNGGTVNKFIGDHIMVLYNVPLDLPDHAAAACRTAFESIQWLKEERAKDNSEVTFGVGINTGPLVAGNMGSKNRMEYTVLGDTVNTSSRLSGVASHDFDEIIISKATAEMLDGSGAKIEDRGEVMVKGKAEPVKIYCLLGFGGPGPVQIIQPESVAVG